LKKLPLAAGLALLAACSDATSPNRVGTESLKPSATLASGNNTVVVREADIARQAESNPTPTKNWVFYTRNAATGAFIEGPSTPPLGTGTFQISTPTGNDKGFLFNFDHTGTAISTITAISYSTYISTPGSSDARQAPSINIQIDKNGGTFEVGDFSTLVFEPVYNTTQGNVTVGSWQTWDAYASGTASWWMTGSALCPAAATLCTWSDVLANYPNATIIGGFGINQGSGNGGLVGAVDALTLGYGGNSVTYNFEDSNCHWSDAGSVRTLLGDCDTSSSIQVPNGFTFDGAGHTITAVDPAGGHFLGAVIRNAGSNASVINLGVTARNLSNVCDAGSDRLRGIMLEGASGMISGNNVHGVRQGLSGCQEGNAIEVRNEPFSTGGADLSITIKNNVVSDYQKNGITANGSVAANITGNTVTGDGPISYIAQNGIQVAFGGTAVVKNNVVTGNWYSPTDTEACGILAYESDGVKLDASKTLTKLVHDNEVNLCEVNRGGSKYNPQR
jgi:hypothetical protein